MSDIFFAFLGANQPSKSGTDVLLDLLSVGSPPAPIETPSAQSSSSAIDILSPIISKRAPVSPLDDLSSLSLSSRTTSNTGAAPMMDLLDGFAPSPPTGGKFFFNNREMMLIKI